MIVRVWNGFWFSEVSGTAFALVRVCFAATAVLTLLELSPLLAEHYTSNGYFPIESARQWSWGNLIGFLHLSWLDGLPQVIVIYTGLIFCIVLLGVGLHTRSAAFVTFVLLLWFQTRNPTYLNGGDEVLRLTAFYLFLGYLVIPPEHRTLSLDRARALARSVDSREQRAVPGTESVWLGGRMPAWPVRMIQIQICLLYFIAGWWKLSGESWWSADAIYYAVQNPQVARFHLPVTAWMEPIFLVASLSVAWWEFLFPALFALRRARKLALLFGVTLHLGTLLTMNIGFFALVVLATYPAMIGPATCDRWLRALFARFAPQSQRALEVSDGLPAVVER